MSDNQIFCWHLLGNTMQFLYASHIFSSISENGRLISASINKLAAIDERNFLSK